MADIVPSFLALEGKHVLITGAAGGIGSAAVKEFLGTGIPIFFK
jgi:NAD(P)-dependent dehydrogenase (short-subunit alcohol dehydrogenase family)